MKNIISFILLLLTLSSIVSTSYAQGLILTAPPRETPELGMQMYGPIAQHLSTLLGVRVSYKHPENWLRYQREMRNDKYDIIFDGPHFISWREQHLGHEAIVKLPGDLQFIVVRDKSKEKYTDVKKLIGKKICGISPPNLSTLTVLNHFRNPVRQPMIKGVKGGMGQVYKSLKTSDCAAAVLRTTFYKKKLKKEQRENLVSLYTSKQMPNQGISVSRRVSTELKLRMRKSLTIGNGVYSTAGLLKRFGGKATSFIPVEKKEYAGYNNLLEGVIFGW